MKWTRESAGLYQAEMESPDGIIVLKCVNLSTEKKWQWKIEWPGGQVARGYTETLGHCKELCEMGAAMYEPHSDGFRKKPEL